ncbi:MAG: DNA cytosine methyltransferase [Candidatus Nealsonbacteria bacterium DGGOD1a]|jgi:DNA-methyltransferase (dcm)|nr:MAG: DNA cytosine methyltransferase [Candidatus Nealsonbacteria bacterium DGGOD1a]
MEEKKLKVIDLFCGVGGLSYGFAHNGNFEIVAANEILPNMAKAYSLNHPTVRVYIDDIKNFNAQKVENDLGVRADEIDIIVGGPPCQAYSTIGKRSADDPRGKLFQEYYRILKEFNPKFFIFENVRGISSIKNGELLKMIISLFESLSYKVKYEFLNAADFGAPQIRERMILTGSKLKNNFHYPEPTHCDNYGSKNLFGNNLKPYLTLGEAIGDLPFIKSGEESFGYATQPQNDFQKTARMNAPERLMDHNAPMNNPKLVKLMELLPDGGTPRDLPANLRPASGYKNTYCRLWWNRPATTITRNLSTPSSSRCIHPKASRPLTTREGARLQCFPDSYQFYGSRSDRNLQIGNAVPTVLSKALAEAVALNFQKERNQKNVNIGKQKFLVPLTI